MGLDMVAFSAPPDFAEKGDVDVDWPFEKDKDSWVKIAYWRKFNHLHGWMENLYLRKGGSKEFNCTTVRLTREDLYALERALRNHETEMPATEGFFFGDPNWYAEDEEALRDFIKKAHSEIDKGRVIFYYSWW